MKKYSQKFDIEKMAFALGVSRSAYYAFLHRGESNRSKENKRLTKLIVSAYEKSDRRYGSPRIHAELKSQGEVCSRKRVAMLMQKAHICAKMHKKRKRTTLPSKEAAKIAPNHLKQNFEVEKPNRVWASDVTYVRGDEGWLYVSVVLDLFSRKVIGLAMDSRLQAEMVVKSLQQAIAHRKPCKDLMHHSDRGVQYTSSSFQDLAKEHGIELSMSAKGHCYDNAVVESFFHTLKNEHVSFCHYRTREEAANSIFEYIETFYNRKRRHSTLGYQSPLEFEEGYKKNKEVRILIV